MHAVWTRRSIKRILWTWHRLLNGFVLEVLLVTCRFLTFYPSLLVFCFYYWHHESIHVYLYYLKKFSCRTLITFFNIEQKKLKEANNFFQWEQILGGKLDKKVHLILSWLEFYFELDKHPKYFRKLLKEIANFTKTAYWSKRKRIFQNSVGPFSRPGK